MHQKRVACASRDTDVVVPEHVTIGLDEIAASAKESLLALAVDRGLQVIKALFDCDVDGLCGPQSKHNEPTPATGAQAVPAR